MALLLAASQLLPTLELAQFSSRQGGLALNDVLSFSLPPLLLTQSFFPSYGQALFSEYVAFVPITAVFLLMIGGWQWRRWPGVLPAIFLVIVGLLLAFGIFNPLNWIVARLPIFNLFRVPARWLLMVTLGISLLAGVGFQVVLDRYHQRSRAWADVPERAQANLAHIERPLRAALFLVLGLLAWNALAGILAIFLPTGPESPYTAVTARTLLLWLGETIIVYLFLAEERPTLNRAARFNLGFKRVPPLSPYWLLLIMAVSLFFGSRSLPYNNLTTPEAYFDLRPPISRLQALSADDGRLLSLSNIFFDVGDQAEIDTIYQDQLSANGQYIYTVAIKNKEVIGPNLPMVFGLSSVDGFDGGILPLRRYSQLMRLILPEGIETTDGRLREYLAAVPPAGWLDLFQARYLITDKTGDSWLDGVFFDRQHPIDLTAADSVAVAHLPDFLVDEIWLLADQMPAAVEVATRAGEGWSLQPMPAGDGLYQVTLPAAARLAALAVLGCEVECRLEAITLVNNEEETFQAVVPGAYRLLHSGDVKIYENLDVLPRAFLRFNWRWQATETAVWEALAAPDFAPRDELLLLGDGPSSTNPDYSLGEVTIIQDEPERVSVATQSDVAGVLVLTEANYQGWQAYLDGTATSLLPANGYFQGVMVPAGEHTVEFVYEPQSYRIGLAVTAVAAIIILIMIGILGTATFRRR